MGLKLAGSGAADQLQSTSNFHMCISACAVVLTGASIYVHAVYKQQEYWK